MKRIGIVAALALIAASPLVASADQYQFTINLSAAFLKDGSGDLLPVGSTLVLLVDTLGNGFGDLTKSPGSWTPGADDIMLGGGAFALNGGLAGDGTHAGQVGIFLSDDYPYPGKQIMLAWYDRPYDVAADGPVDGTYELVDFGTFTDLDPANGTAAWKIPAASATAELYAFTTDVLDVDPGAPVTTGFGGNANQSVPEPASMLTMLVVGGLVAARRRRNRSVA